MSFYDSHVSDSRRPAPRYPPNQSGVGVNDQNYYYRRNQVLTASNTPTRAATTSGDEHEEVYDRLGGASSGGATPMVVGPDHRDIRFRYMYPPTPREVAVDDGGRRDFSQTTYATATTPSRAAAANTKRFPTTESEQTPMMVPHQSGSVAVSPRSTGSGAYPRDSYYNHQSSQGPYTNSQSQSQFDHKLLKLQLLFDEVVQDLRATSASQRRDYALALKEVQREAALLQEAQAGVQAQLQSHRSVGVPQPGLVTDNHHSPAVAPSFSPRGQHSPNQQHGEGFSPYKATGPRWITLWPGTHRTATGSRVLVSAGLHWDRVVEKCAVETACQPAPRLLYTPDGRSIHEVDSLVAGADYIILPSGCRYSEECVPTRLLEKLVNGAAQSVVNGLGSL